MFDCELQACFGVNGNNPIPVGRWNIKVSKTINGNRDCGSAARRSNSAAGNDVAVVSSRKTSLKSLHQVLAELTVDDDETVSATSEGDHVVTVVPPVNTLELKNILSTFGDYQIYLHICSTNCVAELNLIEEGIDVKVYKRFKSFKPCLRFVSNDVHR